MHTLFGDKRPTYRTLYMYWARMHAKAAVRLEDRATFEDSNQAAGETVCAQWWARQSAAL